MEVKVKYYIAAVDFDGTLCENRYPKIGEENYFMTTVVKELQKEEDFKMILWTCREGDMLQEAVDWCEERGIKFDAVNENLPEVIEKYGIDSRKIFAHIYIDDRGITPKNVENLIVKED